MTEDERDLREMFAAARREDERSAPPFGPFWTRLRADAAAARVGGVIARGWIAATTAVALVLTVAVLYRTAPLSVQPDSASISTWKAPTDFLLRIPGHDLIATVPRFGVEATAGILKEPLP